MRKIISVLAVFTLLGWVTVAQAQTQPTGATESQPTPGPKAPTQRTTKHQMGSPGMMEHQRMMEMMCPMMMGMMMSQSGMARGMMGPGMGGMPAMGNASDPKAMARRLKLRGDMMKAMSEVLLKHAQELEQEK
jgi:hypothetical protein